MNSAERERTTKPETPDLFRAATNNDVVELQAALDQGQSLSFRNPNILLMTPIHVAAARGSDDFLRAASEHESFDPWVRDANERLAADHAMAYCNNEAQKLLMTKMYAHLFGGRGDVVDFPDGAPSP